ncbi:uncharacterized protein FIBRA_05307 [Fibroporia radiculosa]|uniref:Exonuclease domain-containing protein n=1 Tax=Fibroporia radiculosa TaxID=599839 RepID=J4GQR6_9APHY|nr:uncharacterized protein FIBRA_05307 [Fibroporia radiculosa]CCM03185.1 predicted protein [Fibroporia radiculosa]
MFSSLGLFDALPCPDAPACPRPACLFTHRPGVLEHLVPIPVDVPTDVPPQPSPPSASPAPLVPAKRPVPHPSRPRTIPEAGPSEPPAKLQRIGPPKRPVAAPTATLSTNGTPVLRVSAAHSQVAIPVRQAMLKSLYDHFVVLYEKILPSNPTLASEHALQQEEEVYKKSTKLTYRNAVISSIASLKRRPFPDSPSHPSVGSEGEVAARAEARKKLEALRLTVAQLEPHVLSLEEMRKWGYIVEIPPGPGGERPTELGAVKTCERCVQPYMVKKPDDADECVFHWGRLFSSKASGEKRRLYTCCSRSADSEGCERGKHVFYDSTPEDLHLRHPFTFTRAPSSSNASASSRLDTALDIVALDCEMVYTTGGFRVARVSVVDSMGKEVFDELVRMDDGVEVIDFNTRFSGITAESYEAAVLPLAAVRKSLDTLINAHTIIIGHALENDLKTLRMIHHRCVDTVMLFPHNAGPPYRRALRVLVKEHLGQTIQSGGGSVGHSSVEDSVATLDLVRWHVLNRPRPQAKPQEGSAGRQ